MSGNPVRTSGRRSSARILLFMLAALAAAVVVGCGSSNSSSSSTSSTKTSASSGSMKVRIAIIPAFGTLPIHVAETQGMFKAQGLDATVTPIQDPAGAIAALGKQFDVALAAPQIAFAASAKGLPLQVITGLQVVDSAHPNSVLIAKQPITDYAQLKGKRVGVIALSGGSIQAASYVVKKAGVDPSSVHFQAVPLPTMADQVKAGKLDAAVSALPFFTGLQGVWVGKKDLLADAISQITNGQQTSAQSAVMVTDKPYVAKNPNAVSAYQKATAQAMDWIKNNPQKARKELGDWLKLPPAVANNAPLPGFSPTISVAALQAQMDLAKAVNALPPGVPSAQDLLAPGASGSQ